MKKSSWIIGSVFLFTLMLSGVASAKPIAAIAIPAFRTLLRHGDGYEERIGIGP